MMATIGSSLQPRPREMAMPERISVVPKPSTQRREAWSVTTDMRLFKIKYAADDCCWQCIEIISEYGNRNLFRLKNLG